MTEYFIEVEKVSSTLGYPFSTSPKRITVHDMTTVVLWSDGEYTSAKCMETDTFSVETGFLVCLAKKIYGSKYKKLVEQALE